MAAFCLAPESITKMQALQCCISSLCTSEGLVYTQQSNNATQCNPLLCPLSYSSQYLLREKAGAGQKASGADSHIAFFRPNLFTYVDSSSPASTVPPSYIALGRACVAEDPLKRPTFDEVLFGLEGVRRDSEQRKGATVASAAASVACVGPELGARPDELGARQRSVLGSGLGESIPLGSDIWGGVLSSSAFGGGSSGGIPSSALGDGSSGGIPSSALGGGRSGGVPSSALGGGRSGGILSSALGGGPGSGLGGALGGTSLGSDATPSQAGRPLLRGGSYA